MTTGRIDVHSHLLPGLDDGCQSLEESVQCARMLVEAGYTHSFCTPHVWPTLPLNTVQLIPLRVSRLQTSLDEAGVPLRLLPGGEINLREDTPKTLKSALVSYAMARKHVLVDIWADELPAFFFGAIKWLQDQGATVILAHPERMKAVQDRPELADPFADAGMLLQGNLQCFSDPPGNRTRQVAEQYLAEGRYFLLGSDLHNLKSLPIRLDGLKRAIELAGEATIDRLTKQNPLKLLPAGFGG